MANHQRIVLQLEVTAPARLTPQRVAKILARALDNGYEESQDDCNLAGGENPDRDCIDLSDVSYGPITVAQCG